MSKRGGNDWLKFALLWVSFFLLIAAEFFMWNKMVDETKQVQNLRWELLARYRKNSELESVNQRELTRLDDLRHNPKAIEEVARSSFGMVGANEEYFELRDASYLPEELNTPKTFDFREPVYYGDNYLVPVSHKQRL